MTPTQIARRSDALYADGTCGMTRRVLCDMVANLESDNAELREQMDWLASSLRNDWQIEASWDGLRRVWHIGWTDEHVENCAECAKGLGAYADSLCDPLKAENAKLRESLERATGIIADICGECPVSRYEWLSSDGCAEKCGTVTEEECWIAYLTGKRWDESGAEVDK